MHIHFLIFIFGSSSSQMYETLNTTFQWEKVKVKYLWKIIRDVQS